MGVDGNGWYVDGKGSAAVAVAAMAIHGRTIRFKGMGRSDQESPTMPESKALLAPAE